MNLGFNTRMKSRPPAEVQKKLFGVDYTLRIHRLLSGFMTAKAYFFRPRAAIPLTADSPGEILVGL